MSLVPCGDSVCLGEEIGTVPHCPHGPALLFERHYDGGSRKFYTCSACRDRKECSFFQWADEKVSAAKLKAREAHNEASQPKYTHQQFYERFKKFQKLAAADHIFCDDCQLLLLPEDKAVHAEHKCRLLKPQAIHRPSSLLKPLDNKKVNAQYLFSDKSVNFVLGLAKEFGYKKLLCIGTPRIHEAVCQLDSEKPVFNMTSLLLDIDHRYEQFYSPKRFCRYNMFNHYFFGNSEAEGTFRDFLCNDPGSVLLITDPPFGGLVEIIAQTMHKISSLWQHSSTEKEDMINNGLTKDCHLKIPVLFMFPYFMEPKINCSLPSLHMLDYKIDYENHLHFQSGTKSNKKGSPVRIFTNLNLSKVILPVDEGYRFCHKCQRYVSSENRHCDKCQSCPSKNGQTYKHCNLCEKCVKPSWTHCNKCGYCAHSEHKCGTSDEKNPACHSCGKLGHKKRECPNNRKKLGYKKRHLEDSAVPGKKKKLKNKR